MIHIAQLTNSSGTADIPLNASGTSFYTNSFKIEHAKYFALSYKASTATPSITLQLEQGLEPPATEGSTDANWVIPVNQADIVTTLNSSATQLQSFSPVSIPHARIKITTGTTPTNTTINLKFCAFEDYT